MRYLEKCILGILVVLFVLVVVWGLSRSAHAGEFKGSIGIQTPVGSPDRPQDDSSCVVGKLEFPQCLGPVTLWSSVEHNLRGGFPFNKENKLRVGGDLPLQGTPLFLYSFWERRYAYNDDRIVVGVKASFRGKY